MKRVLIAALAALAISTGLAAGVGWHYSNLIVGLQHPSTLHEQQVLSASSDRIRLSRDRESLQPGRWALQWQSGFGWVDRVLASDERGVEREFHAVVGQPPVGGWASLRGVSRTADPSLMLGLPYENVAIDGPLGTYPAWFVPGRDSTWTIYVHGRGANRAEGLRTLGVLATRGLPGLLVTYRNDVDAPHSADGLYHFGLTEWKDLEAAAQFALAHGARRLVLSGYSMGGQLVMQFMTRSSLAPRVMGIVLESPVLDVRATIEHRARTLGVPAVATQLGVIVATRRAQLDWDQLERVAHPRQFPAPILLFHCLRDSYVPETSSEAFARALPGRVTFVRIDGGNHVDAWNADPTRYAATVHAWFTAHDIGSNPS